MFSKRTKVLSVMLTGVMALSIAGCGKSAANTGSSTSAAKSNYPEKPFQL